MRGFNIHVERRMVHSSLTTAFLQCFAAVADTAGNGGPDLPPIAALLRPVVGAADGSRGLMQPLAET